MIYDVQFRTGTGLSICKLAADSDAQAIAQARALFRSGRDGAYEIRRAGKLVHVECREMRPQEAGQMPSGYWARIQACFEHSLKTADLEQRRFLMMLAAEFLEGTPEYTVPVRQAYRVLLIEPDDATLAETDLEARDDGEAFGLASILADAAGDTCQRFELWREQELVGSGHRPFHSLSARALQEQSQREVVAREVALYDSCRSIAESRDLLERVNGWLRASMYDA